MRSRAAVARSAGSAALLVALLVATWPNPAAASIDADAFLERIASARTVALGGIEEPSQEAMDTVRARVGLPVEVTLPWGSVSVGPDPMLEQLSGTTPDGFRMAVERLDALRAAARDALVRPPPDREAVAAALERAYRGVRADPSILERIARLFDWAIGSFVERLGNVDSVGGILAWAALLVGLGGLILLLMRLGLVPDRRQAPIAQPAGSTPSDWVRMADEAQRAGDLDAAIRFSFRAVIAHLAAIGAVPDSPSVTAGEARRATETALPAAAGSVGEASLVFERVAYAHLPAGPSDLELVKRAQREVAVR